MSQTERCAKAGLSPQSHRIENGLQGSDSKIPVKLSGSPQPAQGHIYHKVETLSASHTSSSKHCDGCICNPKEDQGGSVHCECSSCRMLFSGILLLSLLLQQKPYKHTLRNQGLLLAQKSMTIVHAIGKAHDTEGHTVFIARKQMD